ncbi:complement factor D-like [Coregonus clupeaformis]|uniref:complement factor D-like n=1 Tax=Coregonus clupeaformis TaxID=59861 RepID=UPI001E1C5782|nr:complement factor D-like [Coregonus clupeaformis]
MTFCDTFSDNMAATSVLLLFLIFLPTPGLTAHQDSGIVNGVEARRNSKPYMVSVQAKKTHICGGGVLVSENFVMTAAHCYTWGVNLMVVFGAHDISRQESSAHRIDMKHYHIHPGYNSKTLQNDIMMLQVHDRGIKTKPKCKVVQQIPLSKKDQDIKAKSYCTVAGWGATKTGGTANTHLLEVNVTVVDRASCQRSWENTATLTPSMICAGGTAADDKGVCQGDSGGPLVCKGTAVRVVSFNEKGNCDKPKKPNVYTKISKYLSWIKCIIKY